MSYERLPGRRSHSFRNFILMVAGVPTVVAGGSLAYLYRDASDTADAKLEQSVKAFDYLATAPPSRQAASRFELTPTSDLLLNSIGAWVIEKSAAPAASVRLHVRQTRSLGVRSITLNRQASIADSPAIPDDTTDITAVSPTMHGTTCSSDGLLTISELDLSYQGRAQTLTNLRLPDQCSANNGLHGQNVTIHGVDYRAN